MQLFQINQSEDSSKITIMSDTTCGQLHQHPITTKSTLPPLQGQAGAGPQHARVPHALRRRLLRRRVSPAPRGPLLRQADAGALPRGAVQGHVIVIIRWNLSRRNLRVSYLSERWIHVDGEWLNKIYLRNI